MRILFVIENYIPHIGGVEIVFKTLAEGLAKKGHKVDIVTHRLKNTKRFEKINNVNVHRVGCLGSRYLFTFLSIPKVIKLAKKADIIHTTTFNGAPPAWLASKLKRKPLVITVHEVWIGKWKKLTNMGSFKAALHNLLEKTIYLLNFDKYACVSKSTQKDLVSIGIKREKTKVVYNAVDYGHFNPKKYDREKARKKLGIKDGFLFMSYGRPGPSKGMEYVAKAVPEIVKKIPRSKFLLILSKDPAYKSRYDKIVNMIKSLDIKENVILHNPVSWNELPQYIKAADCVVIPSLAEGFGFTAAESCAMGIPVVATSAGSLPEVVSGKHIVVKPKSSSQIANAVIRASKGNFKKTKLKKFSLDENIKNYMGIYNSLIKK